MRHRAVQAGSKDFVLVQISVKDYQSSLEAEKIKLGQEGRGQLGPTYTIPAIELLELDGWGSVTMQCCRRRAVVEETSLSARTTRHQQPALKSVCSGRPGRALLCQVCHITMPNFADKA